MYVTDIAQDFLISWTILTFILFNTQTNSQNVKTSPLSYIFWSITLHIPANSPATTNHRNNKPSISTNFLYQQTLSASKIFPTTNIYKK